MSRAFAVLLVAAVLSGMAACGGAPPSNAGAGRTAVRVAAASDLNVALGEVISRFAASHPIDVSVSYGSSGNFFAQLINGAPFDVFLSADIEYPRRLGERGLIVDDSLFTYAVGRLVIWVPAASSLEVQLRGLPVLTEPAARRVAVANPEHAPYGRAAIAALRAAGLYDAVKQRLVYGENIAQTMQFVQSGAADAGIVALSLALAPSARDDGRWVEIPQSQYPRIEQGGAILRTAADADAARAFRAYLSGSEARAILQQYGFSVPER